MLLWFWAPCGKTKPCWSKTWCVTSPRWGQLPETEIRSEGLWESPWSSSLFAFAQKTLKNLPLALQKKKEEIWARLVGKSIQLHVQFSGRSHAMLAAHNFARDLYKGHMTIMRSRHGNSIAEWWKSFLKKDVLEYSKQQIENYTNPVRGASYSR